MQLKEKIIREISELDMEKKLQESGLHLEKETLMTHHLTQAPKPHFLL